MSKIKIKIKSWLTESILFEYEKEDNTIKDTLIEAIKSDADLSGVDLRGVDLRGVDLRGVDLRGADLRDVNLRGVDLSGVVLRGADLSGVNLRGVDLSGAVLRGADLSGVNLRDASLQGADLTGANLTGANLTGANLSGANLSGANLEPIKKDFFDVLLRAIPEICNLKAAILGGRIDGSTYEGECACLCGTLEKSNSEKIQQVIYDLRDSSRPIEIFFMGIKSGDTPENNQFAKIAMEWIEEFEGFLK